MRALLVANPAATTTNADLRDAVADRLRTRFDQVDVGLTKQRGHAQHLVAGAVHDGVDAVFALGGDGTANEVLQGVAGTRVAFCHVPGGGTNVLSRALGAPRDPLPAVDAALASLGGPERRITLGRANGRWFGAIAGYGFDAAIVRRVELAPRLKRVARQLAFVWCGLGEWFADGPGIPAVIHLEVHRGDEVEHAGPFGIAIVGNGDPYTWLGPRALQITPNADFGGGLDLVTVDEVSTPRILRILGGAFRGGRHLDDPHVHQWQDLWRLRLSSDLPLPFMVDGDWAGDVRQVEVEAVPAAVRILA